MKKISNFSSYSTLPVYPILFGLFPVLYLWSSNRAQQPAYVIIPPLLITMVALLVIYLVMLAIVRKPHRAALLTTILSLYILSFGHLANLATNAKISQDALLIGSALLVIGVMVFISIRKLGSPSLTKALNLVAIVLVLFQLAVAAPYYLAEARRNRNSGSSQTSYNTIPMTGTNLPAGQDQIRDVYFILLDNYGRQDVLAQKGFL